MSTAPAAVVLRRAPTAAPARLSVRRLCAINAFWFGNGAHWQPLFVALVPEGAKLLVGSAAIWFTLGTVLVSRIRGVR